MVYWKFNLRYKDPDEVANCVLAFSGLDAIKPEKTFVYKTELVRNGQVVQVKEDCNDPETILRKFWEHWTRT